MGDRCEPQERLRESLSASPWSPFAQIAN